MNTAQQIEFDLRTEMAKLQDAELFYFARSMGIDASGMTRREIETECVHAELYAFFH